MKSFLLTILFLGNVSLSFGQLDSLIFKGPEKLGFTVRLHHNKVSEIFGIIEITNPSDSSFLFTLIGIDPGLMQCPLKGNDTIPPHGVIKCTYSTDRNYDSYVSRIGKDKLLATYKNDGEGIYPLPLIIEGLFYKGEVSPQSRKYKLAQTLIFIFNKRNITKVFKD